MRIAVGRGDVAAVACIPRLYQHLDRQRVVPFGVPISATLLVTIALQLYGLAAKFIIM
ncbi:hypothetical protein [Pseudaminobacter soli (ex Li et al. 2025)]|uniref:hypothetical protein n=1 Tax=Pseudaminobacter soli (ex Li et al. 2025) TaxID=1295366 RepID=UPI0015E69E69|nr:hypothetical protein [Mesorhizobium soli]